MFYASGVAVSADGKRLLVSGVKDATFHVADIDVAGGASYGAVLGQTNLELESFNLYVDPHDPTTRFVYAAMRGSHAVTEVNVQKPEAPSGEPHLRGGEGPGGRGLPRRAVDGRGQQSR